TIIITSSPSEEAGEIWEAVEGPAVIGRVLMGAAFALRSLAISEALTPIDKLGQALQSMEGGNYGVEVETSGPPELAAISRKLNDLAQALT
ncbi:HAMP domain-containing protein, partial [Acinetobacter baumannii]